MNLLRSTAQDQLRAIPEVSRLAQLARCTSLYTQSQPVDALYLIEEGLVKLTRVNETGGKIILSVRGAGQLVGEESLSEDADTYHTEAVVLTAATVLRIPQKALLSELHTSVGLAGALVEHVLNGKFDLAEKVELLCLHDVEHRILHYLSQLASLQPAAPGEDGSRIPITQLELADLIGATRETTSTTLNQLERRGLVKLSRRLLVVPSRELLTQTVGSSPVHESVSVNGNS